MLKQRNSKQVRQTVKPTRTEFVGKSRGLSRAMHWFQLSPPRSTWWKYFDLPIDGLPATLNGFRILHLSDFHFKRTWPANYDRIIDRIQKNPPDLLLITGDMVNNKLDPLPGVPQVRRLFDGLTARLGCFGILGNHDDYEVSYELRSSCVRFLDGGRQIVQANGCEIELIGLPGVRRYELEPAFIARLPQPIPGVPRIVLSHYPDHFRRAPQLKADVFLAGHTHGGQMCLPGGIPILWHDKLPRKLARGVHRSGQTWLVVNRGIGSTGIPMRTFSSPEVLELRLRGGKLNAEAQRRKGANADKSSQAG